MPHPKVKISDNSGNTVAVDTSGASNALKVALVAGDSIDIGDVEIKGHAVIQNYANTAVGTSAENLNGGSISGGKSTAGSTIPSKHIDIMAAVANTGIIYVGSVTLSTGNGIALYGGDTYSIDIEDANLIYVIATEDGENVQFTVYN